MLMLSKNKKTSILALTPTLNLTQTQTLALTIMLILTKTQNLTQTLTIIRNKRVNEQLTESVNMHSLFALVFSLWALHNVW